MAFDVVDGDERNSRGEAEALRIGETDEEGADESRSDGNGYGIKGAERRGCLMERFAYDRHDGAQVFTRRKLGDDSAVLTVLHLRRDDGGKDGAAVFDNGGGSFVAGRFDAKDAHSFQGSAVWLEERFERCRAGPGSAACAEIQQTGSFPGAALSRAACFDEERARGMIGRERGKGIGKAGENDGQLIVEVMRGSGGHGAGAIVARKALHKLTVAGEFAAFEELGRPALWNQPLAGENILPGSVNGFGAG